MQRRFIPTALAALSLLAACQANAPPPPPLQGPAAIPDTQPAVDAPLFVGQGAFANPLPETTDIAPSLVTARVDAANSGVVDGPAPLGTAPVAGSAALSLEPPLLWSRAGVTAGCRIEVQPRGTTNCLAALDTSTMTVTARWAPPGQSLNAATAVLDSQGRVVVTTMQGHLFVLSRPGGTGGSFQVVRDIDLSGHLGPGQVLAFAVADADGDLWFSTGATSVAGTPATDTTVGYVTTSDQVVSAPLAGELVSTAPAVNGEDVYLATAPSGPAAPEPTTADEGAVYDLTATGTAVQTRWREPYDAGTSIKPGAEMRGTGAPIVLLGSQYVAVTDNADSQEHLLVFLQGAVPAAVPATTSTSSTTGARASGAATNGGGGAGADPRLVCQVDLFSAGTSAVTTAPIGYSAGGTTSVVVANGYGTPPAPVTPSTAGSGAASDSAIQNGPANSLNAMPGGVQRIDVLANGSGCQTVWSAPVRLQSAPVLATTAGLLYGYTQDPVRAATGIYVWYFAGIDFRSGNVLWQQRAGAGATKNDAGLPTEVGTDGVLYQLLPLGLVWMHDVNEQP
ncbi:MAG: hypothetical protein ACRDZ8_17535 [Acidimicrobiales bacterium]